MDFKIFNNQVDRLLNLNQAESIIFFSNYKRTFNLLPLNFNFRLERLVVVLVVLVVVRIDCSDQLSRDEVISLTYRCLESFDFCCYR